MKDDDINEHPSGLTVLEREKVGLMVRRIIDESRKYAAEQRGFDVKMLRYINRNVSLEDTCFIVTPKVTNIATTV